MNPSSAAPLREALLDADFTYDAVAALLGPEAHAALFRNETTPARRRTTGGTPLETLVRLFLLQLPVPLEAAESALPGLVDRMAVEGLLHRSVGEVAARLDCRPYAVDDEVSRRPVSGSQAHPSGPSTSSPDAVRAPREQLGSDYWIVSDLTPGLDGGSARVGPEHVLGISSASTALAQLTLRDPVERALDLGTGCGVQSLHLASHARSVVATDVNERALRMARFNMALNAVDGVEVRDGSFFEPVAGERFDLISSNPPFVISPATGEQLVYRDSGLPGDRAVAGLVRAAPDHLADGGWCHLLANWVISRDVPWEERLAGWLTDECDALVVQREVMEPAAYVELWLRDAGLHGAADYPERYDTWLSWLEDQRVEGIGFGWINLHRVAGGGGRHELIDYPHAVEQPIAPAVGEWGEAAAVRVDDASRLTLRPDVLQETTGPVGAEDPAAIVLRQQRGLRRARQVDTVLAAVVGASDGELATGQLLDAVSQILGLDAAATRTEYLPEIESLVHEGYLVPAGQ